MTIDEIIETVSKGRNLLRAVHIKQARLDRMVEEYEETRGPLFDTSGTVEQPAIAGVPLHTLPADHTYEFIFEYGDFSEVVFERDGELRKNLLPVTFTGFTT